MLPLLTFYALALPLLGVRFYVAIWFFTAQVYLNQAVLMASPTFSFLIAVSQAWVNAELCLAIILSIRVAQEKPIDGSRIYKIIKIGRITTVVFIWCFFIAMMIYFCIKTVDESNQMSDI